MRAFIPHWLSLSCRYTMVLRRLNRYMVGEDPGE